MTRFVLEKNAAVMSCPFALAGEDYTRHLCRGSLCMAWEPVAATTRDVRDPATGLLSEERVVFAEPTGYCRMIPQR